MGIPRIGIIGCGMIGEIHAECLSQLGVPARMFSDVNPERANTLAEKYGASTAPDASSLIASSEIDAVYICTYHDTHAELAIQCAKNGKDIFLEKPMALSEKECQDIVSAVEESGVLCMTGFKLRFYPLARKARELIPKPTLIVAHVFDTRWADDSWANDPKKGGGNVLSQGCHAVDLAIEFAGAKPVRLYAEGGNLHHPGLEISETLFLTLTFANGAIASIAIADAGESPVVGKFSFQLFEGIKSLHLYDRMKQLIFNEGQPSNERTSFTEMEETGFLEENREFVDAITKRGKPVADEYAGLRATQILLKAIESAKTHESYSLDFLR